MSQSQLKYVVFVLIMLFGLGGALTQQKPVDDAVTPSPTLDSSSGNLPLRQADFLPKVPQGSLPGETIQGSTLNAQSSGLGSNSSSYPKEPDPLATGPSQRFPPEGISAAGREQLASATQSPGGQPPGEWVTNARRLPAPPRFHRIADGDTLESLALRYLGGDQFAQQIALANAGNLSDPTLLPVGKVLRIPSREEIDNQAAKRELVETGEMDFGPEPRSSDGQAESTPVFKESSPNGIAGPTSSLRPIAGGEAEAVPHAAPTQSDSGELEPTLADTLFTPSTGSSEEREPDIESSSLLSSLVPIEAASKEPASPATSDHWHQ